MTTRAFALLLLVVLQALLGSCGGGDDCKNACDRLKSCALSTSNISCDSACKDADRTCADCLNDSSCADITAGKCTSACAGRTFTKN